MPDVVDWPSGIPISSRSDPFLENFSRGSGVGYTGKEQVVTPTSSRWVWGFDAPINTKPKARLYRTVMSRLKGRYNYLRVPLCDQYRISNREVGAWSDRPKLPHANGVYFANGAGYAVSQPYANVEIAAERGATVLQIYASTLGPSGMTAGVFISIDDASGKPWLYEIENYFETGASYQLVIQPPLRDDVPTGRRIEFAAVGLFHVETDMAGQIDLAGGKFGVARLSLVEATARGA
jgi:hypothetical protein